MVIGLATGARGSWSQSLRRRLLRRERHGGRKDLAETIDVERLSGRRLVGSDLLGGDQQ